MPQVLTFNSLITDLQQYLERGTEVDTTVFEQLPRLINLAERDIARSLKILGLVNVVTSTMGIGQSVYAKPDRWRETVSFNFGVGESQVRTPLFPRSYEYVREYWPDEDLTTQPQFYADYDYANWLISPTPDQEYPFEVLYYELPALLDESNQTNWLTDFAPNALLHGALLKCTSFLGSDDRIPVWQQIYDRDLALLDGEDLQRIIDRSTVRREV